MDYGVIHSEIVYEGKVFKVRVDRVRNPSGKEMQADVVEHHGSVTLLPVDHKQLVWFVRQYRHPIRTSLLELPAGTIETGEDPEMCAIRECREEIGMTPAKLTNLGGCFLAPGYSSEFNHIFLAEDLSAAPLPPDKDEDLNIERIPLQEVKAMLFQETIKDAKSIVGLTLALQHFQMI
jgi:ADP-ribose pyrophosphatase